MRGHRPRRWLWADRLVSGFLPGFAFGVLFAELLFFLNPHLEFGLAAVATSAAVYGAVAGAGSTLLLAPFYLTRRSSRTVLRSIPWTLTGALALTTALGWTHASYFAFYLPSGINDRLIKSSFWLTICSLVVFYTALLHALAGRRYGPRSRLAIVVFTLLPVLILAERRSAFDPGPEVTRRPVEQPLAPTRLLVVGLDAATLDAVLPLAEKGSLPFFSRLIENGTYAPLTSIRPHREQALWTTLATGRFPYDHGIVAPGIYPARGGRGERTLRLVPALPGLDRLAALFSPARAVTAADLRVRPLWDILEAKGAAVGLVSWPLIESGTERFTFALPEGSFSRSPEEVETDPRDLRDRIRLFRVRSTDLDPALLAPFGDPPPPEVLSALAGDVWRENLTSFLLEESRAEVVFLRLPGLLEVSRSYFGGYEAERLEGRRRESFVEASAIIEGYYSAVDHLLTALWPESGVGPRLLAVVSPYGAEGPRGWDRLRAAFSTERAVAGSVERSPDGVLMLQGDAIRPGGRLVDTQLVDVAPTILYALGLPIAQDFEGRVLRDAFEPGFLARNSLSFVPTYDE